MSSTILTKYEITKTKNEVESDKKDERKQDSQYASRKKVQLVRLFSEIVLYIA